MKNISVVINTLNEQKNLPKALSSIKNLADEIIVVDMNSDDKTREIAQKHGAKVYLHEKTNYVEPARNFAISKTNAKWVLVLDADEEIPKSLSKKLKEISLSSSSVDYYRLARKNIIFNKWIQHSKWWPDYNIRFFKKGKVSWNELIHSVPLTEGKGVDLEAKLDYAIIHNNYSFVEQFLDRLNRYTSIQARSLINEGYEFDWTDLVIKPVNEFTSRYFQSEGYKDGLHGLALSGLQAFSEFVKYLKVWQSEGFGEKNVTGEKVIKSMKSVEADLHYWQADTLFKELGGITNRIKRKFRLP